MRGVQFPIDQDAEEKLRSFASGQCDFVQLSVDCLFIFLLIFITKIPGYIFFLFCQSATFLRTNT